MFKKENIQPSVNPKPITVVRDTIRGGEGITGEVFIRNVSIDPRDLIRK